MDRETQQGKIVETYEGVDIIELTPNTFLYQVHLERLQGQNIQGIMQTLMDDALLEEIMYISPNDPVKVYHRKYGMIDTNVRLTEEQARFLIDLIAKMNDKVVNESNPILDGTLHDGSRVNATIPPASLNYSSITIRKFAVHVINALDLIRCGELSTEVAAFLWGCIEGCGVDAVNMLISGGTATGKTTMLNALSMFIPENNRIVTIEDTAELQLPHENIVRMVSDVKKGITMDDLLKNSLRMRPDRIIVGEVRGPEAVTLFGAMNTGHRGCIGTLHANTAKETINRVTAPPMSVPVSQLIGLDIVINIVRIQTKRVLNEITEITGADKNNARFNKIFQYDAYQDKVVSTGVPSKIRIKIAQAAGLTPKQFDDILKFRERILQDLLEQNANTAKLMEVIAKKSGKVWEDDDHKKGFWK